MNKKEMLEDLKKETKIFFNKNKDRSRMKTYKYKLVPYLNENLYIFAESKTESFHCFIVINDIRCFGITVFDKKGTDLDELVAAALKFSNERNKLLGKWEQETKTCIEKLKRREEKRNKKNFEHIKNKTRSLSRKEFTKPSYNPKYTEISEIEKFIKQGKRSSYFTLTYGRDHALNLVINPNKRIIGTIGTFKNTFLFENYSKSLNTLLDDSKLKFDEHAKLIFEASSEAILKNNRKDLKWKN